MGVQRGYSRPFRGSNSRTLRFLLCTRAVAAATGFAAFLVATVAYAEQPPIPLQRPTGYGDYCAGMKKDRNYPCPRGGVPQALWRPLDLPVVSPGAACPVATPRQITNKTAPVLGSLPVYFAPGAYNAVDRATLAAPYPAPAASRAAGTGWTLAKTVLVVKKRFRQPFVVRGRRIDGAGELGFTGPSGRRPVEAMQFPSAGPAIHLGAYKARGLMVWAATTGCYAVQIDGPKFSQTVVFRVLFIPTRG
jgi:hypothetical protein